MANVPLTTPLFKSICAVCDFAEARGTLDEARAVLLEHFRVTHIDDNIKPISSLEQAP